MKAIFHKEVNLIITGSLGLPAWDGSSVTYPSWKERIQTILGLYDLSDKEKGGIVTMESCVKSEDLRSSLLNLSFSFGSTGRELSEWLL